VFANVILLTCQMTAYICLAQTTALAMELATLELAFARATALNKTGVV